MDETEISPHPVPAPTPAPGKNGIGVTGILSVVMGGLSVLFFALLLAPIGLLTGAIGAFSKGTNRLLSIVGIALSLVGLATSPIVWGLLVAFSIAGSVPAPRQPTHNATATSPDQDAAKEPVGRDPAASLPPAPTTTAGNPAPASNSTAAAPKQQAAVAPKPIDRPALKTLSARDKAALWLEVDGHVQLKDSGAFRYKGAQGQITQVGFFSTCPLLKVDVAGYEPTTFQYCPGEARTAGLSAAAQAYLSGAPQKVTWRDQRATISVAQSAGRCPTFQVKDDISSVVRSFQTCWAPGE